MPSQTIYIGTYTEKLPFVDGKAEGIYVYSLDTETGKLSELSHTTGPRNPSYLATDPQKRFLYAVQETEVDDSPQVHAFAIAGNELHPLNSQPGHGGLPCHIAVDPTGQCALSANYETGSVAVYPIGKDGSLGAASSVIQHEGSGSSHERQLGPHAHAVVLNGDNNLLLVPDLGLDQVCIYQFDPHSGTLTPSDPAFAKLHTGTGPRHIIFDPKEQYAFALGEMDATITVFAYRHGLLNPLQTISTLPPNADAAPSCAEIAITADGRFVYASNRGHDTIARFSFIDGKLKALGHTDTLGKTPRDFAIDSTGAFLIVGNQDTDTVVTFRINRETGNLEPTGHIANVPNPVCILPVQR
ncbi:MAG: 6-phosphogluconolactonase [Planctomycetota bacterium]|jgi:6-phosphogluconolactonase